MGMKKAERIAKIRKHQEAIARLSIHLAGEDLEGLGLRRRRNGDNDWAMVEQLFREQAAMADWRASKRGWPDFILRKGEDVVFVEVKCHDAIDLKEEQKSVAKILTQAGLRVFRWSPVSGFERIGFSSEEPGPW